MTLPVPDPAPYPIKRLTREEFAAALRKGQGRAYLHVQRYGLEEVVDLVLEACIHNQIYDKYFESGRGDWLFSLFRNSPHSSKFRNAILDALQTEKNPKDLLQLTRLARNLADQGDKETRQVLGDVVYRIARDPSVEDWVGVWDWLDLEGETGLLNLARIYGQRLIAKPEGDVYWGLLDLDEYPRMKTIIDEYSQKDVAIKAYRDYLLIKQSELAPVESGIETGQVKRQRTRPRKEYTLAEILESARSQIKHRNYRYLSFGYHATAEELETIYNQLLIETDPVTIERLLWVFRRPKLPKLDEQIFGWANSPIEGLRSAAIVALSQMADERIHALAREKALSGSLVGVDNDALNLFRKNYEPGDADLIIQALAILQPNIDDAHSLGISILELAEKYKDPGLEKAVLWTYENTPCAFCRFNTVRWLDEYQLLSDEQLFECQYDAEVDIQEFIEAKSKKEQ